MAEQTPDTIELWGGTPCLDLANSTDWDQDGTPVDPEHNDVLRSVEMLQAWARRLDLLGDGGAGSLERGADCWQWTWPPDDPRRVRFAVAADAVALLGDRQRLSRLARCPGYECGWLFVDRIGRRRWCSMATCGSREKMRRLYARRKAA